MEYVKLAGSDLVASRVGFGCEQLGGFDWGVVDSRSVVEAVRVALDRGINFFDTADVYGLGRSEAMLGKALGSRKKEVIIATKFGVNWKPHANGGRALTFVDCSPGRVREALEGSLRRLNIDCIPLYFFHWPDPRIPIVDTLDALRKCQKEGKIRYFGCANFSVPLLAEAIKEGEIVAAETPYSVVNRSAEKEFLPFCSQQNLSVLAYGVLGFGFVTGKYGPETKFETNDRRNRLEIFQKSSWAKNKALREALNTVATRLHKTPAQVAIRWVLENRSVRCVVVGCKSRDQLEDNLEVLDWTLASDQKELLEASGEELIA